MAELTADASAARTVPVGLKHGFAEHAHGRHRRRRHLHRPVWRSTRAPARCKLAKVPTTVDNQAFGFMAALAAAGADPATLQAVVHGTTTTTNALLERKIAQGRPDHDQGLSRRARARPAHAAAALRPDAARFVPLIERELRLEVAERMDADGKVLTPLDEAAVAEAAQEAARRSAARRVVIHFLHSYINPAHEERAAEIVRALWPNRYVTAGHAILSEYREYERGVTAAVNASVQPVLRPLSRRACASELAAQGLRPRHPGDAGQRRHGVVAASSPSTAVQHGDVGPGLGRDGGGLYRPRARAIPTSSPTTWAAPRPTSALIEDAVPPVSGELELEYAMPIHVPMVDVHTIGAGGGSIASVDAAGHAARRPGERRRAAGADLLRPRRHRADHHRRQPGPGPAQSRPAAGRRPSGDARPCARR